MNPTTAAQHEAAHGVRDSIEGITEVVAINRIHKREGHNPRRFRSQKRRDEMRESIRDHGVLQPVLVRPHPEIEGEFELIAGETRLDLSVDVGHTQIPVLIRDIADEDTRKVAAVENEVREDMSPMDSGAAAAELLIHYKGDKEAVCRELGWSKSKLDGRIQLSYCEDEVAQALVEGEITLGHAQCLSGLRPAAQKGGLKVVLSENLTVDQLKKRIEAQALKLNRAIFDTDACNGCRSNSNQQATLFASSMDAGQCLNSACFAKKTDAALLRKREIAEESYNKVALDRDMANGTYTTLLPSGSQGVGDEQFTECQSCTEFGAVISTALGSEGTLTTNQCFNLDCHTQKAKAYANLIATDRQAPAPAEQGTVKATPAAKKGKRPAADALPKKIVEANHEVHRQAAYNAVKAEPKLVKILAIVALMKDGALKLPQTPKGWPMSLSGEGRSKAFAILDAMDEAKLDTILTQVAALSLKQAKDGFGMEVEKDGFGRVAVTVAKSRKVDLSKHFTLTPDYLGLHTKPVIASLLNEAGFSSAYTTANGPDAFTKLNQEKKPDLLKKVGAFDFDFAGFIPKSMRL